MKAELTDAMLSGLAEVHRHFHLHAVMDLRRSFSRTELEEAARELVRSFPVLGCRYQLGWWRDQWLPLEEEPGVRVTTESVEVGDLDQATEAWARQEIELTSEPGWRMVQLQHGEGCRLVVTVHHLIADGAGVLVAANVVLAHLFGVEPRAPAGQDRGLWQIVRALRLWDLPTVLSELWREARKPATLVRAAAPRELPVWERGEEPRWRTVTLEGEAAERFVGQCREAGVTINDGLVGAVADLAARRSDKGSVAVGYTIDMRRHLEEKRNLVACVPAVDLVLLPRAKIETGGATALRAVARQTGEQKRRLPGFGYALQILMFVWCLPHGLARWIGGLLLKRVLGWVSRASVITNIGAVDEHMGPAGEELVRAWMLGPFMDLMDVPVITATGFRGGLTLAVGACGRLSTEGLEEYARELAEVVEGG